MIKNKQGIGDGKEVLPRVLRESPSDKVTFKQESERKFQGKARGSLGQELSRKQAGRCPALSGIYSLTLLEPMCP